MTARRSFLRTTIDLLFWLIVIALVLGILAIVAGRKLFDRIDEEIRIRAQSQLAEFFPDLAVTLGGARRVDGQGLELRQVTLRAPQSDVAVARIERLMVRCDTDITDWMKGELTPTAMEASGVALRISQEPSGEWTSARRLLPVSAADRSPVPLMVRDIEAEVRLAGAAAPLRATNADIDLLPHYIDDCDYPHVQLIGRLGRGDSALRVEGHLDPREGGFVVACKSHRHELSPALLAAAAKLGAPLADLRVRGTLHNIRSTISGGVGRPLRYRLAGELRGGRVEHPRLPMPMDNVQMQLQLDSHRLQIRHASATVAGAELTATELGWHFASKRLSVDAEVRGLRFDKRLAGQLPAKMKAAWEQHLALGEVTRATWQFQASAKQGVIRNLLDVQCRDLSFHFESLPYRFHRARGAIVLRGRRLAVNLQAPVSGEQVQIVGDLHNVGGDEAYGWMEVGTAGGPVPLDSEMIGALAPQVRGVVQSFRPRGTLKVWGRLARDAPRAPLRRETVIELDDLAVSFERLPYPVDRIRGTMKMVDGRWTFDLAGRNDSAAITCQGGWDPAPADGQHLKLNFAGTQVDMDAELRQALSAPLQRVWHRVNPRGTLDHVAVQFTFDALNRRPRTRVALWKMPRATDPSDSPPRLSIHPRSLPYELDHVTGKVFFEDGLVTLDGLRAIHGQTVWEAQGRCACGAESWTLDFSRLIADNLRIDRELLSALPSSLAPQVSRLQLRGPVDFDGRMVLHGANAANGPRLTQAGWDLNVDVEQGSLRLGNLPVEKIRGQVRVRGAAQGGRLAANGELNIDSLVARGVNVRELRGPLSINNDSLRLGSWAATASPKQVRARVFGGTISADAELKLDNTRRFELSASLSNGQLSDIARSAVPVGGRVAGQTSGTVLLSGTTRGVHTFKGEGYVEMTNADIYEVPVMVTLLQLLSAREHDRSLISRGDANFRVVGDRIYLDQLELDGAVRLKGSGDVNLQRQINLNLYTAMGGDTREGGPALPWLFREASRRILEIEVAGTLESPEVKRRAFPELNDTLQRLFPEVASRRGITSPLPSLRGRLHRR